MNPRIQTIATNVTSEVISLVTTLFYDPASGGVQITFGGRPCVFSGSDYQGPGGEQTPITVSLEDIATECFGDGVDPVTHAPLANVSGAGAVLLIKSAFAKLYDRAYEASLAPPMPTQSLPPSLPGDEA